MTERPAGTTIERTVDLPPLAAAAIVGGALRSQMPFVDPVHLAAGVMVLQAIEHVNRELGTTTIVITHNAPIADMADRVLRLADGRIVETRVNAHKVAASSLNW